MGIVCHVALRNLDGDPGPPGACRVANGRIGIDGSVGGRVVRRVERSTDRFVRGSNASRSGALR